MNAPPFSLTNSQCHLTGISDENAYQLRGQPDPDEDGFVWKLPPGSQVLSRCGEKDLDWDGIQDWVESELAWAFRPYLVFDEQEKENIADGTILLRAVRLRLDYPDPAPGTLPSDDSWYPASDPNAHEYTVADVIKNDNIPQNGVDHYCFPVVFNWDRPPIWVDPGQYYRDDRLMKTRPGGRVLLIWPAVEGEDYLLVVSPGKNHSAAASTEFELIVEETILAPTGQYGTNWKVRDIGIIGRTAYTAQGLFGLNVWDVTDPANPGYIDTLSPGKVVYGLAAHGERVYVAHAGIIGTKKRVGIYNASNGFLEFLGEVETSKIPVAVRVQGNTLFAAGLNLINALKCFAGIKCLPADVVEVFDITDPQAPSKLTDIALNEAEVFFGSSRGMKMVIQGEHGFEIFMPEVQQ